MRLTCLLFFLFISSAPAAVINFDDLPQVSGGQELPAIYDGFYWHGWGFEAPNPANINGYYTALSSAPNVVFNISGGTESATIRSIDPFPFVPVSANFAAAFNDGMTITVTGSLFGFPVGSLSFLTNTSTPTFEYFDFGPVTELDFSASGGILNPNTDTTPGYPSEYFGMDSLTISPEPQGALELGMIFIVGTAVFLFRRRAIRHNRPIPNL